MTNLNQGTLSPSRDLNHELPAYEARMLPVQQKCWIKMKRIFITTETYSNGRPTIRLITSLHGGEGSHVRCDLPEKLTAILTTILR